MSIRLHLTALDLINCLQGLPSDTFAQDLDARRITPHHMVHDLRRRWSLAVALMQHCELCEYFIVSETVLSGVRPLVGVYAKEHRISDRSLFVRFSLWGRSSMRQCYAHSWRGSRGRCKGSWLAARKEAGIVIWKWNVFDEGCFFR